LHQILKMIKKNIFSILVAMIIMYLSLANSNKFEKVSLFNFPFADKIVHFGMYFVLMTAIVFVNRESIKRTTHLFWVALIPLFYGILMEVLQSTLTITRSASFYDVVFNTAGVFVSILLWLLIKPVK
jgi:VanZ family protein